MMVPDKTHLYFIALIATEGLAEKIRQLQLYCSETYQSKKALRSPPHVTLIPPFREDVSIEEILQEKLTPFFSTYSSLTIELNGFGKFDSSVIFIKPVANAYLENMQEDLRNYLSRSFSFVEPISSRKFNPHVTIASGDLRKKYFHPAWEEFESKVFNETWNVPSAHLLKHDGKMWHPVIEFPFHLGK
jgi:2'-5' RNA ligase